MIVNNNNNFKEIIGQLHCRKEFNDTSPPDFDQSYSRKESDDIFHFFMMKSPTAKASEISPQSQIDRIFASPRVDSYT